MAKLRCVEPVYEYNSGVEHPEHQVVNTRVSHYLRLYASGKINEFPTNGLRENPELPEDLRKDILNRNLPLPEMGTDPVEIMDFLTKNREKYENLVKDYNLAIDDKKRYDKAMEVINDPNAKEDDLFAAMRVVEAIKQKARARYV